LKVVTTEKYTSMPLRDGYSFVQAAPKYRVETKTRTTKKTTVHYLLTLSVADNQHNSS